MKKGLTKEKKCAGDFISKLIKSPLVNRGKSAIDEEKRNDLHPYNSVDILNQLLRLLIVFNRFLFDVTAGDQKSDTTN